VPANQALIGAVNRAALLLDLPPLLIKAFIAVEGADINHRDGVLQVIPATRAGVIARIERGIKLAALGLDGSALSDNDLSARFAQAFDAKNALVQVLTGAQYIKEQLNRFNGFIALAGLAYNAGPGRAASEIQKWGGDPRVLALQYHKAIGPAGDQVTVQAGIVQTDPATGAKWTRFPVIANDTGREIFQYLYLRRVPNRNWGLLDFIFNPSLLSAAGLFENDPPPSDDWRTRALVATDGEFRFSQEVTSNIMFNTQPLSQRDPAWANVSLGFADAGQTLGSHGCTVTVLTMMANGFGFQETPATLNEKLRALGPNQGFFGPLVAWYGVPRALPGLVLNKLVDCRKTPAPMAEVDAALDAGKPIVAEVDMSPNPNLQNHWVLIYARKDGDYLIHDPWPVPAEASASLKQRYGFAGEPAHIITFCAFFDNPNFHGQPQPPADEKLVVVISDAPDITAAGGLALRDGPNAVGTQILTRLPAGTVLDLLEPASTARQKIGVYGQWLNVTTPDNKAGWVAAWYVTGKTISAIDKGLDIPVQPPLLEKRFVVVGKSYSGVYIRSKPQAGSKIITKVKGGTQLEALDAEDVLLKKVGKRGEWLHVSTDKREMGYISAQYVGLYTPASRKPQADSSKGGMELMAVNEPDAQPALRITSDVGLNLRDAPSMTANRLRVLPFGTVVLLREPLDTAQLKLGKAGTWVAVRTLDGITGFVSGEWVELLFAPPTDPTQPIDPDVRTQGVALAVSDVALMKGAGDNSGSEWRVTAGTPLRLLNRDADWNKIGNGNAWIQVESYAFKRGFVRGSALRAPDVADRRGRVLDGPLPYGICAWLYGLHDEFDKGLFAGSNKTGWVLMTHRVQNGEGRDYTPWSRAGYGVIARLNNDYGASGTIPTPDKYDQFAAQCRSWAANSRGCLIYVIGNEMNNPREWPNQDPWNPGNNPNSAITPELYAACFNRVRAAIKSVQPNAIVVPGAVDPFQGPWMSSLDYFNRMLAAITDLDGLALHCYTNGYSPDLIPSLQRFENDPLRWQYYHFRAYTTFLDAIPPRHRNKPVYITETDPHGAQPWAGGQNGWVQAAYAEIDRYNLQTRSQQIQCAILYRWSRDDIYSIVDKPAVQADIRATINGTDYRWRA
jgi:hypothetical protein